MLTTRLVDECLFQQSYQSALCYGSFLSFVMCSGGQTIDTWTQWLFGSVRSAWLQWLEDKRYFHSACKSVTT